MIPEHLHIVQRCTMSKRRLPSLVDLCVQKAIDNLKHIGDVGETDFHLLERFLSHCTVDQLMHIEDSTEERDLSPVTNKLWKKFYEKEFGSNKANIVVARMKEKKVSFKWKQLYEAKMEDTEEAVQRAFDRFKESSKKEDARKQSRKVRLCTKVPPSTSKRSYFGGNGPGSSLCNTKSGLMKKAKLEFLNSREVKNLTAMKKSTVQNSYRVSSIRKPGAVLGKGSASTSKVARPIERGRF